MRVSFRRYLLIAGGALVTVIGATWAYVAAAPMAFMESGYASWAAKATMLERCELGQIALFGDSRLEAGVMPAGLPVPASNFGLAAGTPIEAERAVDRAVRCPQLPLQEVLALVPEHFGPVSEYYWLLSLRYGFLSAEEAASVRSRADALGDRTTLATPTPDGLGGPVRDWLYALHFPSLSFSSLVQGRVFGRLGANRARYEEVLGARGWAAYLGGELGREADPAAFQPTPTQRAAFEGAIGALRARGIAVGLLVMPFSASHPPSPAVRSGYVAYLQDVQRRIAGVQLLDDGVPIWPDRLFADGAHLRPEGARAFTARLAACVRGGLITAGCDVSAPAEAGAASR